MSRQQDEGEDAAELLDNLAISLADARERAIRAEVERDLARAERDAARHELRVALGRLSKVEAERDEARARMTEWEVEAIRAKAALR